MKRYLEIILCFSILVAGCAVIEKTYRGIRLSVIGGYSHGGIVENTYISIVPNASPTPESTTDAFSGATFGGPNMGVHINKPLFSGEIETGIDYIYNHQTFSYADQGNIYNGFREFDLNQVMIPLAYNFTLFKKSLSQSGISLTTGVLGQYNITDVYEVDLTRLPDYYNNEMSGGATVGVSACPLKFNIGSILGLYLEAYRGSRIYTDYYNQKGFEMPGSSFLRLGLRYQFRHL